MLKFCYSSFKSLVTSNYFFNFIKFSFLLVNSLLFIIWVKKGLYLCWNPCWGHSCSSSLPLAWRVILFFYMLIIRLRIPDPAFYTGSGSVFIFNRMWGVVYPFLAAWCTYVACPSLGAGYVGAVGWCSCVSSPALLFFS